MDRKQDTKKAEAKKPSSDVVIKQAKMPENMAKIAVETTQSAIDQFDELNKAADFIKAEFEADKFVDEQTGEKISTKGVWHCVIGRKFGSFVTFAEGNYIMFYIGQTCVLLWKSS